MDNTARIERIAAQWLVRRDSGAWSDADRQALESWLAASTLHRVVWLRLEAAWQEGGRLKALGAGVAPGTVPARGGWNLSRFLEAPAPAAKSAMQTGESRPGDDPVGDIGCVSRAMPWRQLVFRDAPRRVQAPRVPRSMVAGVVVLVAAGAGVAGWWHLPIARGIQTTPVGETRTIELPDGSRATLSSASRVRWAMSRSQRTIELEQGEVFVDVAADANRVFVVAAGSDRAVAIGTRFSVRKADRGTRVVVTEGRVRFSSTGGAAPAVLQPGMVAVAGGSELRVESMPLDQAEGLLSWREGYLGFRNTPLAEAVAEFNRYNTRRLVIADPAIATIPIGGNFRWNNIDVFVRLLEQGFELRAEMRDRDIVLHAR